MVDRVCVLHGLRVFPKQHPAVLVLLAQGQAACLRRQHDAGLALAQHDAAGCGALVHRRQDLFQRTIAEGRVQQYDVELFPAGGKIPRSLADIDAAAVKGHGSVFAIYNVADARMGFYTTNPLYFKRGGYYKVTVSLNTKYVENGKAYLALGKSKDLSDNTIIEIAQKDSENNGWNEYTFYVYANENTADELYFHFGLGKDSDNKAKGYILIDDLKIEETDDTTQTGDYVTDNRFKAADNKLTDAFVNKSGADINGVPVTITGDAACAVVISKMEERKEQRTKGAMG